MKRTIIIVSAFALSLLSLRSAAQQQLTENEIRQANNPMSHVTAVNLHNYYAPKLVDGGELTSNTTWIRVAQPMGRFLIRASMPINTMPSRTSADAHSVSALGDASIFAILRLGNISSPNQFGIGPLVVAPTSTNYNDIGSGKWQLGAAALAFLAKNPLFQSGLLVTWQASVAGSDSHPDVSLATLQPFLMWQLGGGTYLRSAAIWNYDLESGYYNIPVGLGLGKVVKINKEVFNIFLEPQYSLLHYGAGQPQINIFAGFNLQF